MIVSTMYRMQSANRLIAIKVIKQYCIYNHRTTKTNQKYPSVNL